MTKINKVTELTRNIYFEFEDKPYSVIYNKDSDNWRCSCFNGSNMGVNNKQLCKHKKVCMRYLEELEE